MKYHIQGNKKQDISPRIIVLNVVLHNCTNSRRLAAMYGD